MSKKRIVAAVSGLLVFIVVASTTPKAHAQNKKKPGGESINIEGVIEGLVRGYMKVVTDEGETWVVAVGPKMRNNRLVGSAEVSWLGPGMYVEFEAQFDKNGNPQSALKQLKVFTPGKETKLGIESTARAGGDISFTIDDPKKKKPPSEFAPFKVTGQLRGLAKGVLTVTAGRATVQVPIAEETAISVDVADLRGVQIGDKVRIRANPVAADKAVATSVQVTATKPLGASTEKKPEGKLPPIGKKKEVKEDAAEKKPESPSEEP